LGLAPHSKVAPRGGLVQQHARGPLSHSKPPTKAVLVEVVDEKNKQILLIRNAEGTSKGLWNGFGGKIEEGETPCEGAKRELFEEAGLTMRSITYQGALTAFLSGAVFPSFMLYVFSSKEFTGRIKGDGKSELRWFPLNALPYITLWHDDAVWLPYLLAGRKWVNGHFEYAGDNLLRVAEILPLEVGEDFGEKDKRSVGIL